MVTAMRADTADSADQIWRTAPPTPGSWSPTSTIASRAADRAAAIIAATTRSTASATHSTGSTPAAVSRAIATRFPVRGRRTSAPTMASSAAMPLAPASHRSRPSSKWTAISATINGNVLAAVRALCSQIQSLPTCTGNDAADSASMNATNSSVMPPVTTGASRISGTRTRTPRCSESQRRARVRPPPPMIAAITSPTGADTQS
jgi:hypothetical protein